MPRVDVLMPTYKPNPAYLREAIDSVRRQTHVDWRLLINDEPTDVDTRAILEPLLRDDARIQYQRNPVRLGIGPNWNACMARATAPAVMFLFQDDWWEPTMLERCLAVLDEHANVGFVAAGHRYVFEDNLATRASYEELERFRSQQLQRGLHDGREFLRWWLQRGLHPNVIGEPDFVMLRRTAVDRAGPFHPTMTQFLDSEYWMKLLIVTDWYHLPDVLGSFRVHGAATSATNFAEGKGAFDRLMCYEELLDLLPPGADRELAAASLSDAFGGMIRKFLARRKAGGKVGAGGSGALVRMALRHPVLLARGIARSVRG